MAHKELASQVIKLLSDHLSQCHLLTYRRIGALLGTLLISLWDFYTEGFVLE